MIIMKVKVLVAQSCPTLFDPMDQAPFCPRNSLDKYIGVGCHPLLQGIFPTQGSNLGLLHCRQILYHLSHERELSMGEKIALKWEKRIINSILIMIIIPITYHLLCTTNIV